MRLFVTGSVRHFAEGERETREAFQQAATDLGREVARREHVLLVHAASQESLAFHMVEGLRQDARERGVRASLEVHRAVDRGRPYSSDKDLDVVHVSYRPDAPLSKRLGVRAGGVVASHAVLVMGGGSGTQQVGHLATELQRSVVAVSSFGGAAREIYDANLAHYIQRRDLGQDIGHLANPWSADSARAVVDVCEALSYKHSYFISYAHEDAEVADHLEVLLRRREREVYRDEHELRPADPLTERLSKSIGIADTFLGIWSHRSSKSKWCRKELEIGRRNQEKGPRPRRVVLLQLDKTSLPADMRDNLHLDGADRNARTLAVEQLVTSERVEQGP